MTQHPSVNVEQTPVATVITPTESRIDETKLTEPFRRAFLDAAQQADPATVIVDLSQVTYFSSSFIELLFRTYNRVPQAPQRRFILAGLTDYCQEIIEISGLHQIWELAGSREEALALAGPA